LQASSGSSVKSTNVLTNASIEVNSSSGADVKLKIEAEQAVCESSSGSHIEVSGKAIRFQASTSSGSGIDAQHLLANEVKADASSGSVIEVHPLVSLTPKPRAAVWSTTTTSPNPSAGTRVRVVRFQSNNELKTNF
jgi:hypothetical protein